MATFKDVAEEITQKAIEQEGDDVGRLENVEAVIFNETIPIIALKRTVEGHPKPEDDEEEVNRNGKGDVCCVYDELYIVYGEDFSVKKVASTRLPKDVKIGGEGLHSSDKGCNGGIPIEKFGIYKPSDDKWSFSLVIPLVTDLEKLKEYSSKLPGKRVPAKTPLYCDVFVGTIDFEETPKHV